MNTLNNYHKVPENLLPIPAVREYTPLNMKEDKVVFIVDYNFEIPKYLNSNDNKSSLLDYNEYTNNEESFDFTDSPEIITSDNTNDYTSNNTHTSNC